MFSRTILKMLSIIGLIPVAMFSEAHAQSGDREQAFFFDYWAPNETTNGVAKVFGKWQSPSQSVTISCLKSSQDLDSFILVGQGGGSETGTVLGYGIYSVSVKWLKTAGGEIAVIDNGISNGLNELIVVRASKVKGKTGWRILYKTPDLQETAKDMTVAHCNWSLIKLDPDLGSMRIKAAWDFSDANAKRNRRVSRFYDVPLFYGGK